MSARYRFAMLLASLALLGAPTFGLSSSEASEPLGEARTIYDMNTAIQTAKRDEAVAEGPEQRGAAIRSLCDLHNEIAAHPRYAESITLKRYQASISRRLGQVHHSLRAELAAEKKGDAIEEVLGGGAREDHGQELVELIQRTIAPDYWDVAGGPGTIVYFAPRHALVVRANSEMQGNLQRLFGDLRAAGQ